MQLNHNSCRTVAKRDDLLSRAGCAQGRGRAVKGAMKGKKQDRGVATILAMMFLVLFSSLAAAMAIASRGNLRTAATHLHVMRAQGAAETGLAVAAKRLQAATSRFVVSNSDINASFATQVWSGNIASGQVYTVASPRYAAMESPTPDGVAEVLLAAHVSDANIQVGVAEVDVATIGNALTGVSSDYAGSNWVYAPAVGLEAQSGSARPPAYSIIYAPLANGTDVRIIATGYDFDYSRTTGPITRTVMQDFRMGKRVKQAIVSPTRIQIGKNVLVSGDLGARYTDVTSTNGDPLVLRSDFLGLNSTLDLKLNAFFTAVQSGDVDGDNRLRASHPSEGSVIPSNGNDYNGDGQPDGAFADVTGDGFVDEFDIFINHFDANHDGKVALHTSLSAGTPNSTLAGEFLDSGGNSLDSDLAILIDTCNPDRNRNNISGFTDTNRNGLWDSGEAFTDYDAAHSVNRDQVLGFRDGVIDRKDMYGKVRGKLVFKTSSGSWVAAQGNLSTKLRGPIRVSEGEAPRTFSASDTDLPVLNSDTFASSEAALKVMADGASFSVQVGTNLGIASTALPTYVETQPSGSTLPRYLRVDPDANYDGLPDNYATAYWEKMPYNAPAYTDVYYRPVYENMVFRNVKIPMGTNALFRNCQFIGVTHVETATGNTHVLWNEYGKLTLPSGATTPAPSVVRMVYGDNSGETSYPTMLPSTAIPPAQMIIMAQSTPLDKADVPASSASSITNFSQLPDPLVVAGRRVIDTKTVSNNIRFHDCLVVGSIVSDKPGIYTQVRNKLQFTGSTRFTQTHPDYPTDASKNPDAADMTEIAKSSMMLPNYSVDIGTFNSPPSQNVQLSGAVVAGVLDMRGNVSLDGALLLTFNPVRGTAPMIDALGNPVGNTANYNTTIGYFGPSDGDSESLDPATLPIVGGIRIVGWDTNGDGLADVAATSPQPSGSTAVPFYGYGRIQLRFNPNMTLPNGIMLPMHADVIAGSYREGRP